RRRGHGLGGQPAGAGPGAGPRHAGDAHGAAHRGATGRLVATWALPAGQRPLGGQRGERGRRRSIVCRHLEEAKRQRQHREEVLAALRQELSRLDPQAPEHTKRACELVASPRYGRYLTRGPGRRLAINAAAVRRAERMDGTYVLLTNDETLTTADVGAGYKAMMIIEACFRRMNTTGLRIRPVYHGTAHRLASH